MITSRIPCLENAAFSALTFTQAEAIGENELVRRLAVVLGVVAGGVAAGRSAVIREGAAYIVCGRDKNPFSGETHQCVRGNFSFWAYWVNDPLMVVACTLHVVRPTSDEMFAWHTPLGCETGVCLENMRSA